jgi:hypothetical protein
MRAQCTTPRRKTNSTQLVLDRPAPLAAIDRHQLALLHVERLFLGGFPLVEAAAAQGVALVLFRSLGFAEGNDVGHGAGTPSRCGEPYCLSLPIQRKRKNELSWKTSRFFG